MQPRQFSGPYALTSGEPAGIGPEICIAACLRGLPGRPVIIGDRALLEARARAAELDAAFVEYGEVGEGTDNVIEVVHVPLGRQVEAGRLDAANGAYVLATLDRALDGCMAGEFRAMVTAPVSKAVINDAGIPFTGHTEYLAERAGNLPVVMMLVGGGLRVALATTHLALADVPRAITRASLAALFQVLDRDLRERFRIVRPRILVAGLNPHAGESGHLGREEIDTIAPAIEAARAAGMDYAGPIPADTLFVPERLKLADCALAMYHDQGLPVLKYASFGRGVNVTLGLPYVRTSVDHGTALELAGTGRADAGSLIEAALLAIELAG